MIFSFTNIIKNQYKIEQNTKIKVKLILFKGKISSIIQTNVKYVKTEIKICKFIETRNVKFIKPELEDYIYRMSPAVLLFALK